MVDECRATGAGVADAIIADLAEQRIGRRLASIRAVDSFVPLGPATSAVLVGVDQIVAASVAAVKRRRRHAAGCAIVTRAAVAFPARGSYGPASLHSLPPDTSMGPPRRSAAPRIRPSGALRPRRSGGLRSRRPPSLGQRVSAHVPVGPPGRGADRGRPRGRGGGGELDGLVHRPCGLRRPGVRRRISAGSNHGAAGRGTDRGGRSRWPADLRVDRRRSGGPIRIARRRSRRCWPGRPMACTARSSSAPSASSAARAVASTGSRPICQSSRSVAGASRSAPRCRRRGTSPCVPRPRNALRSASRT